MKRPGRYALRLAVVVGIVAALIGVGVAWRASSLASVVADGGGHGDRGRPPGFDRGNRGGSAFSVGNIDDLLATVTIGGGVLATVIVIDKTRRRRRPIGSAIRTPITD